MRPRTGLTGVRKHVTVRNSETVLQAQFKLQRERERERERVVFQVGEKRRGNGRGMKPMLR